MTTTIDTSDIRTPHVDEDEEALDSPALPAEKTAPASRGFSRKNTLIVAVLTFALIGSGAGAAILTVQHVNAEAAAAEAERVRLEEAARAETASLQLYTVAYEASIAEAGILATDAQALTESGSALLAADDLTALSSLLEKLSPQLEATLPAGADSASVRAAFRELDATVVTARADLSIVVGHVAAAAQTAHDSYTLADAASLQSLQAAMEAFHAAAANRMASAEAFATLNSAISAAAASHQAAVDLAAAAAQAAASGKKTYTHNGQTYYSGTTTPAVPGTTSPPAPGTPGTPSEPVKSAATKASELAAKYGGSTSVVGACGPLNHGHVTGTSAFGPSTSIDGYYSAVEVTSVYNANYVNYYFVQWYACPN